MAQPFHRFDDGEGSRSVAERFVIVSKTKLSPVYRQRSVVTFHVANIVTVIYSKGQQTVEDIEDVVNENDGFVHAGK